MTDVFLDIDGQPNESLSIISERLEARSLSGQFLEFTKKYFDLIEVNNQTSILELGGGTGVIGRNFIGYKDFKGKYTVSDLSAELLKYGLQKAKRQNLDKVLNFEQIDAMANKVSIKNYYDIVIMHTLISHVPDPKIVLTNAMKYIKKSGKIIIFDADYETLLMSSGDKKLDDIVNNAIKKGCVAQPKVMREIPKIAKDLDLNFLNYQANLLFEAGEADFFYGMGKALSTAVVKSEQLDEIVAKKWISKLEESMKQQTFFGMCPYITYIYEV
jgi:ubiquinone/menaquinone biosynthesis C-methylase UbiE